MKTLFFGLCAVLLVSCGSVVPVDETPGPHQTLLAIARMAEKGDFTGADAYVLGVEYGKNLNSADNILDGFKLGNRSGDFSFSLGGFVAAATDYKHLFVSGDPEVLEKYFLKEDGFFYRFPEVKIFAEKTPEKIWSFQIGDVIMIQVEVDGVYKILFSRHMGALSRRPK